VLVQPDFRIDHSQPAEDLTGSHEYAAPVRPFFYSGGHALLSSDHAAIRHTSSA
jgi:hypothetical protein